MYGYNCTNLEISLNAGKEVGKRLTIFVPGNGGNLLLNTKENGGDDSFKEGVIYSSNSPNTNEIVVNCRESDDNDECKDVAIYGEYAKYVEFNCTSSVLH